MLGVKDETLRRELCKVQPPTLAAFDNLLEAHALVEASEKLRPKAQANRAAATQRKSGSGSSGSSTRPKMSDDEKKRRKLHKGKCFRCGSGEHMMPDCKFSPTVSCNSCKSQGHIAAVCLKSSPARASPTDSPADPAQLQLQYHPSGSTASSFYTPSDGYAQYNQPTPQLPL